ncbi:MAG TPA: outer membrane beta-barrel protein [Terracidiphilus sp.]|nr:outer membrane beta-barrel protein [Terracidiphilus sp.]
MPSLRRMFLLRNATLLSATAFLAAGFASALSGPSATMLSTPAAATESSSADSTSAALDLMADNAFAAALPADPAAAMPGGGQRQSGRYRSRSPFSNLAFAVGGGFNAPTAESSPYITWGGNVNLGVGYRFNPYFSLMTEYQFISDKLPGALIAQTGADGGHAHIWSLTMAPVLDLMPYSTNSIYVTGGGGFYRKVTSFTDPVLAQYCNYFYCGVYTTNVVVGHFSSNQGGWNIGAGFTHRLGGMYGDSRMKLFAEVRYLDVLTPAVTTQPNGLGTTTVGPDTKLVPVTFGVRW